MASLKTTVQQKLQRLEDVPDEFINAVNKNNREVYQDILQLLDSLERSSAGKITASQSNLAKVEQIVQGTKASMFDKDYTDAVLKLMDEFDGQARLTEAYLKKTFGNFSKTQLHSQTLDQIKLDTLRMLDGTQLNWVFQPVREQIRNAVATGGDYFELVKLLRKTIEGSDLADGVLTQHVKTVVRDSFTMMDRVYTQAISADMGIEFYEYAGGTVRDSREFCLERVGNVYHIEEIKSWSSQKWQGKNYETTHDNIIFLLGGYNCIHSLMPVATEFVSDADKKRAASLGYYHEVV